MAIPFNVVWKYPRRAIKGRIQRGLVYRFLKPPFGQQYLVYMTALARKLEIIWNYPN
jgi:hypothetical protein